MTMTIQEIEQSPKRAGGGKYPFKKAVGDASNKLDRIRTDVDESLLRMITTAATSSNPKLPASVHQPQNERRSNGG